jgi:hypothetical protein
MVQQHARCVLLQLHANHAWQAGCYCFASLQQQLPKYAATNTAHPADLSHLKEVWQWHQVCEDAHEACIIQVHQGVLCSALGSHAAWHLLQQNSNTASVSNTAAWSNAV